jgi:hypothetical protein
MRTSSESSLPRSKPRRRMAEASPRRYEPTPIYVLAERLKRQGLEPRAHGPWRPGRRSLRRPGRQTERSIPIVTNGVVEIAVDTAEHAVDVSAFLNVAGVDHLDPVPNLRPPEQDLAEG